MLPGTWSREKCAWEGGEPHRFNVTRVLQALALFWLLLSVCAFRIAVV